MAMSALEERIFAIDRIAEIEVRIGGTIIAAGLAQEGNVSGINVSFDIEQMPPTCSITFAKQRRQTDSAGDLVASGLPTWIEQGMDVRIKGGYGGQLAVVFTGRVKKRRHAVGADTLDCVGRTGKLTRPFRATSRSGTDTPFLIVAEAARAAIERLLDQDGVDFNVDNGEQRNIDDINHDDGSPWILGTVVDILLDMATPADMVRKIADVYGHRIFELPTGMLRIRDLLEVPGPSSFRTYTTDPAEADQTTQTTLTYADTNIDAAALLGNVAANTRRSQGFEAAASAGVTEVSMWVRRVGSPTDRLRIQVLRDAPFGAGPGLPSVEADALIGDTEQTYIGKTLDLVTYTQVRIIISSPTELKIGTTYHLVISRTGALDAANYYEVGIDQTAPGYADGQAGVFDGAVWAVEDAGGDQADHPFQVITNSFAALRVLDIGDDEDEDQIKKKIIVRGAAIPSVDAEGNEIVEQVEEVVTFDDDDLVSGDPDLFAMTYQNDVIDTDLVAAEAASRLFDKFYRVLKNIEVEVPFDPRMQLGTTITIDDPDVTGVSGQWWVQAYTHSLVTNSVVTQMSLFGGDQSGVTGDLLPQPDFHWEIEHELIGTTIQAVVTFFDDSHAVGGWIVSHQWQDDYAGGANDESGYLPQITFAYDPATDASITMTLTVIDNKGNTNSVPKTINLSTDNEEIYVPIIACAAGNTCMLSLDGGLSWTDIATPGGQDARTTAVEFTGFHPDAPLLVFFGTQTGNIYRSGDGLATLVLEYDDADNSPITSIVVDVWRRNRIWATTLDGKVVRSIDFGANWAVYADLGGGTLVRRAPPDPSAPGVIDPSPINGMLVSGPTVDRIWVFGGVGDDPATWFATNYLPDGPNIWHSEIVPGDGVAVSTGNAADTVVDVVVSHQTAGDLGLLFSGRDPVFIYSSRFYPAGEGDWVDIIGTPADDGVGITSNNNRLRLFGMVMDNTNFYRSQDGYGTWEELVGVLPGTGANRPHDLLNISAWRDVFLTATDEGIGKSIDYGETWAFLRPNAGGTPATWPGGAIGYDLDIEYRRPRQFNIAAIVASNAGDATVENALAVRTNSGGWEDHGPLPTGRDTDPHRLRHWSQISDDVFFFTKHTSASMDQDDALYRSPDGGAGWVNVLDRTHAIGRGSDGTLWASSDALHANGAHTSGNQAHAIYNSTDGGLTWNLIHEDTTDSGGTKTMYVDVAIDPADPRRIAFIGHFLVANIIMLVTIDGGSSWSRVDTGLDFEGVANNTLTPSILAGQNERWIIGFEPAGETRQQIYTNDQNGAPAAWVLRYDNPQAAASYGFGDRLRAGNILYFAGTNSSTTLYEDVLRSVNNGTDWEPLVQLPPADMPSAIAWDSLVDLLFASIDGDNFFFMPDPTPAQTTWGSGVGTGLEAAMGYTDVPTITRQGLVIARAAVSDWELWAIGQNSGVGGDTHIWLRETSQLWKDHLDIPDTDPDEVRFPIWHFPGMGQIMFRLKIGDLGSSLFGYGGPLERSTDRGLTWSTVLANAGALARGSDGKLWATADDRGAPADFQPRSIYRSIDNGISWVLQDTDTSSSAGHFTKYSQIRVDPNNANRIMAVGARVLNKVRSAYSDDGGASWTFNQGSMSFREGGAAQGNCVNLEAGNSGRWIMGLSQTNGLAKYIFITDDGGANWTQKYTVVTTALCWGWADSVRAGGTLYLAGNGGGDDDPVDGRVTVSVDNGDTWAAFTGDDRTDIKAITWDGGTNTLFIGRADTPNVLQMLSPSVAGTWDDITIPSAPRVLLQESLEMAL